MSADELVEDVWLDMLMYHVEHPTCSLDDMNLPRFLRHAISMLKHFEELVSESLAIPVRIDQILAFTKLAFDDKLFDALVRNVRELPRLKQQTQAGVLYLILESCQVRKNGYRKWCDDILKTGMTSPDAPIFAEIQKGVDEQERLMIKYERILCSEFRHCTKIIDAVQEAKHQWLGQEE